MVINRSTSPTTGYNALLIFTIHVNKRNNWKLSFVEGSRSEKLKVTNINYVITVYSPIHAYIYTDVSI